MWTGLTWWHPSAISKNFNGEISRVLYAGFVDIPFKVKYLVGRSKHGPILWPCVRQSLRSNHGNRMHFQKCGNLENTRKWHFTCHYLLLFSLNVWIFEFLEYSPCYWQLSVLLSIYLRRGARSCDASYKCTLCTHSINCYIFWKML